ncbi:hypothetical protein Tco_0488183 [Tanacetum coccineum]
MGKKLHSGTTTVYGEIKERFPVFLPLTLCKRDHGGNENVATASLTSSFRRPSRRGAELTQTEDLTNLMHAVSLNHMQDRIPYADGHVVVPIKVNTSHGKVMTNSDTRQVSIFERGIDNHSIRLWYL